MKNEDEILNKAIKEIKEGQVPIEPPENLADETLEKLNQVSKQLPQEQFDKQAVFSKRLSLINSITRIAALIILLILVGYAAGRLSSPKPPDMKQIQAMLEPAIREKLLNDVTGYIQLGLASGYVQIRQELTEQYRQDLMQVAQEILNTSGDMTNQRLVELIQVIAAAQLQDRQWIAAAIQDIEQNRLQDKNLLGSAIVNVASKMEQNLQQTQQDVAVLAKYLTSTNDFVTNEDENSNN